MSLFFGRGDREQRAVSAASFVVDPLSRGRSSSAGVSITDSRALSVGAQWSSVNLLASIVSNFPVDVFRGSGQSKRAVSPLPSLAGSPSFKVSRRDWVYQAMMSLLLRGNAYGLVVERDSVLRPTVVEWLNPDNVRVIEGSALDRLGYEVGGVPVSAADVIHMRAFVRPGSAVGMSPVEYHAEAFGVSLSAQRFGASWFADGAVPSAIFKHTEATIPDDKAEEIKRRFMAKLRRRREPLVVGKDWEYQQISVNANESQFLDAMGYGDAQIARLYGPGLAEILGYGTSGSTLTYSNRVDRSLDLLTYSVMPWVNKFEDMWTANIAQPQTARMNVSALLRADPKSQREMFRIDREIGLHSIDEIRNLIDEPPLPDGQGQDYTPLKAGGTPQATQGAPNGQ